MGSRNRHYENEPFEIPISWEWVQLDEVCQIVGRIGFRGYTKNDLVEKNGAITLSPSNIIDGKMDYSKCIYISWNKYEESPEIQIHNGDILLVKTGSSFGKCALVEGLPQEATINPQFVTLKFISVNAKLLTFILQSRYARKEYDDFVLGTAIPTFTQTALGEMLVPLIPQNEQQRLLDEIERWFKFIENLEDNKNDLNNVIRQIKSKVLDLAIHGKLVAQDTEDESASELLKRIAPNAKPCDTSHYGKLPQNWCVCRLKDVFDITMGSSPSGSTISNNKDGIEFHQGKLWFSDTYLQQSNNFTNSPTKLAKAHSILLCVRAPVGEINITEREICIGRGLCALKPKANIDFMFAFYALQTHKEHFDEQATGTTFKAIGRDTIRDEAFILPPYKEQIRIRYKIEDVLRQLEAISTQL